MYVDAEYIYQGEDYWVALVYNKEKTKGNYFEQRRCEKKKAVGSTKNREKISEKKKEKADFWGRITRPPSPMEDNSFSCEQQALVNTRGEVIRPPSRLRITPILADSNPRL